MTAPRDHSWLHDAIEVRDSPIHGRGLFTTQDLTAGTLVIEIGGIVIDDAQLDDLIPPFSTVDLDNRSHLLIRADDPARFGNHSCDPNLWLDGPLRQVARRDIRAGEELTIDYATQASRSPWKMLCTCGTEHCRVLITGDDWRDGELQTRYENHWHPQLLQRRDRSNEW